MEHMVGTLLVLAVLGKDLLSSWHQFNVFLWGLYTAAKRQEETSPMVLHYAEQLFAWILWFLDLWAPCFSQTARCGCLRSTLKWVYSWSDLLPYYCNVGSMSKEIQWLRYLVLRISPVQRCFNLSYWCNRLSSYTHTHTYIHTRYIDGFNIHCFLFVGRFHFSSIKKSLPGYDIPNFQFLAPGYLVRTLFPMWNIMAISVPHD